MNPVYRAMNKPTLILGMDKKVFFLVLMASTLVFRLTSGLTSIFLPLGMFFALSIVCRILTRDDHQLVKAIINSARLARYYDASLR